MITFLLCTATLLSGCIKPDSGQDTDTKPLPPVDYHQDAVYAYRTDVDESILKTELAPAYLLLANKQSTLSADYVPAKLTTLTCATYTGKQVELEARAAAALYEMLDEMHASSITDIMVTSGYRDYGYQVELFNYYLRREQDQISDNAYKVFSSEYIKENYLDKGKNGLSVADAEQVVLSYSARPGTSEHQTGLCVDFVTEEEKAAVNSVLTEAFADTKASEWLRENAYRFGFILRYPKGKEDVTGYTYEPWHYRFVGREAATDIYKAGITLEEYLLRMQ